MDVLFDISHGLNSAVVNTFTPRESSLAVDEEPELKQSAVCHKKAAWVPVRRRRGDRSGALCELLLASLVLHALFCLAANKSCFQFQRHSVGCIKIAVFGY